MSGDANRYDLPAVRRHHRVPPRWRCQVTLQGSYHRLLAAARSDYEMGYCDQRGYDGGVIAIVTAYEREKRIRREQAREIRRQRRERAS